MAGKKKKIKTLSLEQIAERDEENKRKGLLDMTEEERKEFLPQTREVSRQVYLKKRQRQQLEMTKRRIADEERFFGDEEMTKAEYGDLEKAKKALKYATERENLKRIEDEEYYHIPKAKYDSASKNNLVDLAEERRKLLHKRFEPEKEEETEQELVEKQKLAIAIDPSNRNKLLKNKFELVDTESPLEYIKKEILRGKKPEKFFEKKEIGLADLKKLRMRNLAKVRRALPIFSKRETFLKLIKENQVLVVVGETGSGKTTQIPQYLHEAGFTANRKKVGITQPRRVAAMSVAARVSDEMGTKLGREVGYSIRFEDCTGDSTVIKYMTDGMLLREFLGEPELSSYSVLMIDEAHERTLHTDVLFGLVKDVARYRKDLKIIISSATLDTEKFKAFFDDAPCFEVEGRLFDVRIFYVSAPQPNYVDAAVTAAMQIHLTQPPGDILIFLTGQQEIDEACEELSARSRKLGTKAPELVVCPIYSALPADQQRKIFYPAPERARKVIVATNIAETSLTIDGIVYVVDSGFCKQKVFNPRSGMDSLLVSPISKASAEQRAGRAGRVRPGKCYRLYTKHSYQQELEVNPTPEIQRSNLGGVVLLLKSLGIDDVLHFDFLDPPPAEALVRALELLYALGALNSAGDLTRKGRRMAEFPLDPPMSCMLVGSGDYGCSSEIVRIAAMLGVSNAIFYKPKQQAIQAERAHKFFQRPEGDHHTLLNIYHQWEETEYSSQWCFENFVQIKSMRRARDVKEQLEELLDRVEVETKSNDDPIVISKAITSGYFYNTAMMSRSGKYKTYRFRQTVTLHPSSVLREEIPRWVIFHEFLLTSKKFIRTLIKVNPEWLLEVAPHMYKAKDLQELTSKKQVKLKKNRRDGEGLD